MLPVCLVTDVPAGLGSLTSCGESHRGAMDRLLGCADSSRFHPRGSGSCFMLVSSIGKRITRRRGSVRKASMKQVESIWVSSRRKLRTHDYEQRRYFFVRARHDHFVFKDTKCKSKDSTILVVRREATILSCPKLAAGLPAPHHSSEDSALYNRTRIARILR